MMHTQRRALPSNAYCPRPALGSVLLLWLGWISAVAWMLVAAQLDSLQWRRLLTSQADQMRSAEAVESAMSHAKADLLCPNCRPASGTPWATWPSTSPPAAVDADPNFALALNQRWQAQVAALPLIATRCEAGLCALDTPSARSAADWLDIADSEALWVTGSVAGLVHPLSLTPDPLLAPDHTRYWIEPWLGTDPSLVTPSPVWLYRVTVLCRGIRAGTLSGAQAIWMPLASGGLQLVAWRWLSR